MDTLEIVGEPTLEPSNLLTHFALESIPAGFPSPAADYHQEPISLDKELIANPQATFFARAGGDSMLDAGIAKGDLIVVDRSLDPRHGDIVVADIGNSFAIKRLYHTKERTELRSENKAGDFPTFIYREGDEPWTIVGVVTACVKTYPRLAASHNRAYGYKPEVVSGDPNY